MIKYSTSGAVFRRFSSGNKVVYLHRRGTDNSIFYVGMGTPYRPKDKKSRNRYWWNVVEKNGYDIEVIYKKKSKAMADWIEENLIAALPDLTNICPGGEGGPSMPGEQHPNFSGHWFFFNLEENLYWISTGGIELEKHGFHTGDCSRVKNGEREYLTSKRIHKNGVKIRFDVVQLEDIDEIVDLIAEYDLQEAELSDQEIRGRAGANSSEFGKTGSKSNVFRGYSIGVNENQIVILDGAKQMKENGFNRGVISECISGTRKSHKSFRWFRSFDLSEYKSLNLIPFNEETRELLEQ
jgi:hypothetical protein